MGIRLWLSPVFGVLIPTFSGLVDPARHGAAGLLATYIYFSFCAFIIWTTNRWLYLRLPRREDWLENPLRRISVLLGSIFLLTIPVSWLTLMAWMQVTGDPGVRPYALEFSMLAIVTVVVIITHVYETVFLLAEWDSARLRAALLEQERLRAELAALSREVDPHFLFNSLHSLAHLVEHGSSDAVPFIEALGDSYRYVLSARERPLVPLSEEIAALRRQHLLTRIRFGGAVRDRAARFACRCHRLPADSAGDAERAAHQRTEAQHGHVRTSAHARASPRRPTRSWWRTPLRPSPSSFVSSIERRPEQSRRSTSTCDRADGHLGSKGRDVQGQDAARSADRTAGS